MAAHPGSYGGLTAALTLLALAACAEPPNAPRASEAASLTPLPPLSIPSATIVDGAHGGNARFYFLPPLVPAPSYGGAFDAGLSPIVEVCRLAGGVCDGPPVATFTMDAGTGSSRVRVDPAAEQYGVVWQTKEKGLDLSSDYRVSVSAGPVHLGYLDIAPYDPARGAGKPAERPGVVAHNVRAALNITFRIETGIVGAVFVNPPSATVARCDAQQFTADVRDLHGGPLSGREVVWSSSAPAVATVDAAGLGSVVRLGNSTVSALVEGVAGSAQLTGVEGPVAEIRVSLAEETISAVGHTQATAGLYDKCGQPLLTKGPPVWASSAPAVASVDASGLVTGESEGTAEISASAGGVTAKKTVTVTRAPGFSPVFSDDFSAGLGNWVKHDPNGLGTWFTQNDELIGDYNIVCGSPGCHQTDLLLVDQYQPGRADWRIEVQSGLVQAYCCYNGGAMTNMAKFSLWVSDSEKEEIEVGSSWQGTEAPTSASTIRMSHQAYPWHELGPPDEYTIPVQSWVPSAWQTAALEKHGNQYTAYFNGVPVYSATRTFSSPPKVGLHTYARVRMDNFKLFVFR